jgi:hypothetical protein
VAPAPPPIPPPPGNMPVPPAVPPKWRKPSPGK